MFSMFLWIAGKNMCAASKDGLIMKLINPTWLLAILVVHRSMNWDTSCFRLFSVSPWLKNSTKRSSHHFKQRSNCLVELEMSARWNNSWHKICFSDYYFGSRSSERILPLKMPSLAKWCDMSVARMASIMIFLNFLYLSYGKDLVTLYSGSRRIANELATWWFSSTDMSLYLTAILSLFSIIKMLL